jgi:DNA adenine methylase
MNPRKPAPRWVSPLRYPGGKACMTPWLVDVFNSLNGTMDVEVWLEPFGGGAGAALMALEAHDVPEAWIVESNPALAAFWTEVMNDGGQLAARVETTTPTLAMFDAAKEIVTAALAGEKPELCELAFAAFLLNRCSRSGLLLGNVGPIGGKAQAGRYGISARFNGEALAQRLRAIAAYGSRFRVHEGDGIRFIEQLAGSGIEDEVFVFADPPYMGVGNALYAHGMCQTGHARLAAALRNCPAPWVLTYDAHPEVLALYQGHRVVEFEIPHTVNKQKIGTEYLVLSKGLTTPTGNPLGKGDYTAIAA